jgi:hypothetical protein
MEELRIASSGVGFDLRERTRRQALRALAIAAGLVVVLAAVSMAVHAAAFCMAILLPLLAIPYALVSLLVSGANGATLAPGTVVVGGGAIRVLDSAGKITREIPLDQVTQGFWEEPDQVHLATRSGETLVARAPDAASGERLLHACGVTAAERVLRVPLASATSRVLGGTVFAGLALTFVFITVVFGGMVLAFGAREIVTHPNLRNLSTFFITNALLAPVLGLGWGLVRAMRRREAVVGADGIVFRRVRRSLFIPYTSVTSVTRHPRGVRVERRDGPPIVLPTQGAESRPLPTLAPAPGHASGAEAEREVLYGRIVQAMAARDEGALAHPDLERLDRRDRSLAQWREELRKLLDEQADYRRARLTTTDLARVIEDAGAPAERRIAAAVALASAEPEEARRRVRIAVDACADDELRRALESAAEGEIDEAPLKREERRG